MEKDENKSNKYKIKAHERPAYVPLLLVPELTRDDKDLTKFIEDLPGFYDRDTTSYTRYFTKEEIQAFKDEIPDLCKKIFELEEELEIKKAEIKMKMDPLKKRFDFIQQAFVDECEKLDNGVVFKIKDEVGGRMNIYDRLGRWIMCRPLQDNERQMKITVETHFKKD